MDQHHLHLITNHLPVFGLFFSIVLLALSLWLKENVALRRIAFAFLIFTAVGTVPVFLTGEGAEHALEEVSGLGISHAAMHDHEESGELAFYLMCGLGVLAIAALVYTEKAKKAVAPILGVLLLLSLGLFGFVGYVSNLGGKIHRPTLRGETVTAIDHLDDAHDEEGHEDHDH